MTSRIQTDGDGKEAKWADIDDDEDDWAPETIEWNDGTKITLTHTENLPLPNLEDSESNDRKEAPRLDGKSSHDTSKSLVSRSSSSIGPNATILKLGGNAEKQTKSGGIVSKGQNDKPTLTSKSAAPPVASVRKYVRPSASGSCGRWAMTASPSPRRLNFLLTLTCA